MSPTNTTVAIACWKYEGAPFNPIGTLNHSYTPKNVIKAVNIIDSGCNGIRWYPAVKSITPKYFEPEAPRRLISSSIKATQPTRRA